MVAVINSKRNTDMSNLGAEVPVVGKSSKQERLHFWQNVIKEQKTSGKTIKEYCQYHNLDFDTFRRWQYRLNCKLKNPKANRIDFMPVVLTETKPPETFQKLNKGSPIKLELEADKISLTLDPFVDESTLAKILMAVRSYYASSTR
jgi:hypothetical protein